MKLTLLPMKLAWSRPVCVTSRDSVRSRPRITAGAEPSQDGSPRTTTSSRVEDASVRGPWPDQVAALADAVEDVVVARCRIAAAGRRTPVEMSRLLLTRLDHVGDG